MKAYIAGKITGVPDYKKKFQQGVEALEKEGFVVLNPAVLPEGMSPADYMKICFAMIDVADVVAFLPDWTFSDGARLECDYCSYTSKEMLYLGNLTSFQNILKGATDNGN